MWIRAVGAGVGLAGGGNEGYSAGLTRFSSYRTRIRAGFGVGGGGCGLAVIWHQNYWDSDGCREVALARASYGVSHSCIR
jgi:hypothetical protein